MVITMTVSEYESTRVRDFAAATCMCMCIHRRNPHLNDIMHTNSSCHPSSMKKHHEHWPPSLASTATHLPHLAWSLIHFTRLHSITQSIHTHLHKRPKTSRQRLASPALPFRSIALPSPSTAPHPTPISSQTNPKLDRSSQYTIQIQRSPSPSPSQVTLSLPLPLPQDSHSLSLIYLHSLLDYPVHFIPSMPSLYSLPVETTVALFGFFYFYFSILSVC